MRRLVKTPSRVSWLAAVCLLAPAMLNHPNRESQQDLFRVRPELGTASFEVGGTAPAPPRSSSSQPQKRGNEVPWDELEYRWKHLAGDMAPFNAGETVPAVHDSDAPVWAYLQFRMRKALGDLARLYMARYQPPEKGSITSYNDSTWWMGWWPDYVVLTGDREVRDYCYAWRDSFIHSVEHSVGTFSKGYVKKGDIDHQNEDVVRFLMRLWAIDPSDPSNTYNVRAMAPLLGNWVDGVPPWYDYDKHRWRGFWLGTEYVEPSDQPEVAFSWLCLIALQAYRATHDARYLRLVEDFCGRQGAEIVEQGLDHPLLQIAVYNSTTGKSDAYASLHGFGPWRGASFRLAGGLAGIYTDLYQLTGNQAYLGVARQFLDHTVPDMLYHMRGMSEIGELCQYRRVVADERYDRDTIDWLGATHNRVDSLHVITEPCDARDRKYDWLHGCETRSSPSPTTYNLAYLITGEEHYLDRAVEMALDRVRAIHAEEFRESTRSHDQGDWNWFNYLMAWEVADAFFPTAGKQYGGSNESLDWYEVKFLHEDGAVGLPRHIAAQYLPRSGRFDERRIRLYNAADDSVAVRIRPVDIHRFRIATVEAPGSIAARVAGDDVIVSVPSHRTVRATIRLER